ncbi:MAG: flagellar filament capping protein FliD [Fimbriimonadaceae bacterium]|nr:flagellar filament capping protein FliD [Fimbriimonadaceae bacterium]
MSIGSNLAGISFTGLGSGIDTASIVERLIALEQIPIQRLQQRQAQLTQRMSAYTQLRSRVSALSSAANNLNSASAYNPSKAASSDTAVATVTASSGAVAGSYGLKVSQLAQAQKLGSSAQTAVGDALNLTGSFTVNGKSVSVVASDSLTTIAQKINSAGGDVVAGVIDGGPGQGYLTMTGSKTGRNNRIELADSSGNVLSSLGFLSTSLRTPIAGGAASYGLSSATKKLSEMLDMDSLGATNVTIGGDTISVSADDTLTTLADKINALGTVSASVVSQTVHGETTYRLQVDGTTTFGTEGNFWLNVGVLKRSNEIVAAQDAKFQLDNVALSSSTNTVTSVIPNVTINLLKADATTPSSSTLTVTRDNEQTKKSIKGFIDAFNSMIDFVRENSKLDKETYATGLLFGDAVAGQIESNLSDTLFQSLTGVGTYSNFSQLGVGFDENGKLSLDEAVLDAAISADPESIGNLMRAVGTSSAADIKFVTSGAATKASGSGGYEINITQAATKTGFTSSVAQTSANAGGELLTFSGAMFGSNYQLSISAGLTLEQTRDLINADSKLKDLVVADISGGKLTITSKKFGTPGGFDVVSNLDAAANNSGIGKNANKGILVAGLNVAGTINGQAATGSGQFLTGASAGSNKDADGLQVQYTGTGTGVVGYLTFTKGVAAKTKDLIESFTDAVNGLLTATDKSLQTQFDDLGTNITSLTERASLKRIALQAKFTAMEQAISQLQSQQSRLQSILGQTSR